MEKEITTPDAADLIGSPDIPHHPWGIQDWLVTLVEDLKHFRAFLPYYGERQSVFLTTAFGVWTILPWINGHTYQAANFAFLLRHVPEKGVGCLQLLVGLLHCVGIGLSWRIVSRNAGVWLRAIALIVETMVWIMFAASSLISYPPSLGLIAFSWYAYGAHRAYQALTPTLGGRDTKGDPSGEQRLSG